MKAVAVGPGKREVRVVDVEHPKLAKPTDVMLRMLEVGVCGTDREICAFEYGTPPDGNDYLIIGHESLGEVIEAGAAVEGLKKGDLIVTTVRRPCPYDYCVSCTTNRADFCYTGSFTERGINRRHGFMAEFVVDDQANMNKVPRKLRDVAVLVEPLTIAEKAIEQIWDVQTRLPWACPHSANMGQGHCHSALVLGAGPVGLLGAMALAYNGFNTFVYSREKEPNPKADIVKSIGATYISAEDVPVDALAKKIGNIDVVYEATGASALSFKVIEQLGTNGIFVFTGVPGRKAPIQVDTDLIMRRLVLQNQVVFGSVNASRANFRNAIRDLAMFNDQWPEAVRALITGRHPVEAHRELLVGAQKGIKNVIAFA
ncbi:MAG: glucose 1-dehydrogenase [Candidatus Binataceae bacterium]